MSPETAEAVRSLFNICGDTNEVQPTQQANRSQGVSGAASGAPVLRANHRSQEGPSAVSTKRQARQDQVTTMCCENRAWKKARLMQKRGLHLLAYFLLCVLSDQLYICSCAVYTGLLFRWCESTAAIARVSEAYLVSHCTMERRQAVYLQIESETGGREGVVHPGIVIAPAVDVVLLGSMFFVEDR